MIEQKNKIRNNIKLRNLFLSFFMRAKMVIILHNHEYLKVKLL